MTQAWCWRKPEVVELAGALSVVPELLDGAAVALVMGIDRASLAKLDHQGNLDYGPAAKPVAPYEVRAFNEKCELRWLRDVGKGGEVGATVLLGGDGFEAPVGWEPIQQDNQTVEKAGDAKGSKDQYLLWGDVREVRLGGWARLFEHRIGDLFVPIAGVSDGDRVALRFKEVLAVDDVFGNVAVIAERLVGLVPVSKSHTSRRQKP